MMWLMISVLSCILAASQGDILTNSINQPQVQTPPHSSSPTYYGWASSHPASDNNPTYDGYLVPVADPNTGNTFGHAIISPLEALTAVGTGAHFLHSLIPYPRFAIKIISKVGMWIFGFISFLLLGGLVTSTVCALTPICTISFLGFGLNRESVRSYLTQDKLTSLTTFVTEAINKYKSLQKKPTKED